MGFNITLYKCWVLSISSKIDFQGAGLKVKVTIAIFRKKKTLL